MGNEEFNLSEKTHNECYAEKNSWIISEDNVKEFIKKLKKTFRYSGLYTGDCINKEIDKLAGNKLIA